MGASEHSQGRKSTAERRWLLRVLLVSVGVNTVLGLWALLIGDFGQTEGKVLVTSLLVTAAMTSVLVNAIPIERRLLWPVPAAAAASGVFGFVLLIGLLWSETDGGDLMRLVASVLTFAAAATVVGLLALIELAPRYEAVRVINRVFFGALVVTTWWGIWSSASGDWYGRLVGVESVLAAATMLAIPVLARFESAQTTNTVGGLATFPAVMIEPTSTLRKTIEELAGCGADIAVVRDSHSVSGVVTATDLLWAMHDGAEVDEVRVADVMSVDPLAASSDTTVERAAELMIEGGVRQLLVTGEELRVVSMAEVLRRLISGSSR